MRDTREINRQRMQYGVEGPFCVICRQPTDSVSVKCEICLERAYREELLERAEVRMRKHPDTEIELAADKKKRVHLTLFGSPYAWCGTRLTDAKRKHRERRTRLLLPGGLCQECMAVYEGWRL